MRAKWGGLGVFALFLCAVLLFCACAAGDGALPLSVPLMDELNADSAPAPPPESAGSATVALLATETRFDTPFGQSVWQAVSRFAGEQGMTYAVYKAGESADDARATLELAITSGAQAVVCIGSSASGVCAENSASYPGVAFILLDLPPGTTAPLAVNVRVDALSTGWMAGYAAVRAGMLDIACVWQDEIESQTWAFGFMKGMDAAARETEEDRPVTLHPVAVAPEGEEDPGMQEMLLQRPRLLASTQPQWESVSAAIGDAYAGRLFAPLCQEDVPAGKLWALVEAEPSPAVTEALMQWHEGLHDPRQQVAMNPAEGGVRLKAGLGNASQDVLDDAANMAANPGYRTGLDEAADAWLEAFCAGEANLSEMLPYIDFIMLPGAGEELDSSLPETPTPLAESDGSGIGGMQAPDGGDGL